MNQAPDRENAIRVYTRKMMTKKVCVLILSLLISALSFGACLTFQVPSEWIIMNGLISILLAILLVNRLKGVRKIEFYSDGFMLIDHRRKVFMMFKEVERLHYSPPKRRLVIETKRGDFHRIDRMKGHIRQVLGRLEDAVYGKTHTDPDLEKN
ncbi:MAG: hypothetical protein AAF212_00220 [Verrucomicrobiota bacterium]